MKNPTGDIMQSIINLLTSRGTSALVAFLLPLIVTAQTWLATYAPDAAAKIDPPVVSNFVASAIAGIFLYFVSYKFSKNKEGVKAIQRSISGSQVPINVKIDGVANPKGETVQAVEAVVSLAENK